MAHPRIPFFLQQSTLSILKRLLREYIRPYVKYIWLAVGLMMVSAASTAALAKFLQPIIDTIFIGKQLEYLFPITLMVLATFLLKGFGTYGETVTIHFVGQRIIADLQTRLFEHFTYADFSLIQRIPTGALISRFTNDVWLLRSTVSHTVTSIGKDALTFIFLVSLMMYQDWKLAIIAFFALPVAILPMTRIAKRLRKVTTTFQEDNALWTSILQESWQGARLIRAYGMEQHAISGARRMIDHIFQLHQKSCRIRAASHPIMEFLGGISIVAVILYGGYQVIAGGKTAGTFVSFIGALLLTYEPLKRLAQLNHNLQEGLAAASRLFHDLDLMPHITNPLKPLTPQIAGAITFQDVSFRYHGSSVNILQNLSFSVPVGKKFALVGPSGGGKSTLINLIPRFYDVTSGSITIDGNDIRSLDIATLRQHIALVSQEIMLFDDTITANIAYGKPNASEAEIFHAAQMAAAHDFIKDLPEGYQTRVGELGFKLSGGQRQRIAIARAFLKNAPILLLDEATSSLDTTSEQAIQESLRTLSSGRTTLVVTHRLSAAIDADYTMVMDQGQIVEEGPHKILLKKKGLYAKLFYQQEVSHETVS